MVHTLTFDVLHSYDAGAAGITVPIRLSAGNNTVTLTAKLDTGASYCIFERGYAELLGFDIERGHRQQIGTAVNSFTTFGHEVTLTALGFQFDITAYFALEQSFNRNVLGRFGWLQLLQIGIVDYSGQLYVNQYQ